MRRIGFVLALLTASCGGGKKQHKVTAAEMPAPLGGLMVGSAKQADVEARFPGGEVGKINYNDVPMVTLDWKNESPLKNAYFRADDATLVYAYFKAEGLCDWVDAQIATKPGARDCPGNRKTGGGGSSSYYCLARPDGPGPMMYECSRPYPPGSGTIDTLLMRIAVGK